MDKNKIARVNGDVMRVLSSALGTVKDPRIHGLVSITRVSVSGDLKFAKVYVSLLGGDAEKKELKKGLYSASGYLKRELARVLNMRNTPELEFVIDDSITRGAHILDILNNLDV